MLFIYNNKGKFFKHDFFLNERVCSYQNVHHAFTSPFEKLGSGNGRRTGGIELGREFSRFRRSKKSRSHVERAQIARKGGKMLTRKNFRGRHVSNLKTGVFYRKSGNYRNECFPRSYIALQKPRHGAGFAEVA